MGGFAGLNGIDGHPDVAVRPVLEADGAGQGRGQLSVNLRLGGAGTDRPPADEIGQVEEAGGIEKLGGSGQPQLVDVEQQLAREPHAVVDVVAAIQMGIEHQPLPAHSGAGLLEIGAHHYLQPILIGVGQRGQPSGVVEGGEGIVDGAGANHHQQAIVLSCQDPASLLAVLVDPGRQLGGTGMKCQQVGRSGECLHREGAHYRV